MVNEIRRQIGRLYKWFWYDCCQLREPFTCVLSRMIVANGVYFWTPYVGLQWLVFLKVYDSTWLARLLCLLWLSANTWLIDHLIDYIRNHPENVPNINPLPDE